MTKLTDAVTAIEREFGKGSLQKLSDQPQSFDAIPSGALTLDFALGGGYPRGRVVEIFGPESSGKTSLLLHLIANAQAQGLKCAFIDAEHALDPVYASALGVDTDELLVAQPDYGEQGLEIADRLAQTGEVGVVAVDSVAALTPRAEIEGQMGDQFVGLHPRMMSQGLRKLAGHASKSNTLIVFTNQIRMKVGVVYGNPEVQPGGRALPYWASQRLDVRRVSTEGDKGAQTHNATRVRVVKNKVAPPFREALFDIRFGQGIDNVGCVLDLAESHGLVKRSGAWYSFDDTGEAKAQGREAAKEFLRGEDGLLKGLVAGIEKARR